VVDWVIMQVLVVAGVACSSSSRVVLVVMALGSYSSRAVKVATASAAASIRTRDLW
jgi:hypothetical protein